MGNYIVMKIMCECDAVTSIACLSKHGKLQNIPFKCLLAICAFKMHNIFQLKY